MTQGLYYSHKWVVGSAFLKKNSSVDIFTRIIHSYFDSCIQAAAVLMLLIAGAIVAENYFSFAFEFCKIKLLE